MWSITILLNSLSLLLFWITGFIAIAPAYNHFVQYAHLVGTIDLPILTQAVFAVRLYSLAVPVAWLLCSLLFLLWFKNTVLNKRNEWVQLHSALSVFVGLVLFVIFLTAGILPFLKIGVLLD